MDGRPGRVCIPLRGQSPFTPRRGMRVTHAPLLIGYEISESKGDFMMAKTPAAKTVSETDSAPPAKVGVVVASTTKTIKNMPIPELMEVMAPAAAEYNEAIGAIIHN